VSVRVASLALSVFAIFGMVEKLLMGFLAERITARYALMINLSGQAIFLVLMIWAGTPMIMWIAIPLFGYFHGAFGVLFQLVVQSAFGVRHYGSIMGTVNMTTVVSFGIGPILAGASFDLTGSYRVVFITVAALFLVGALALSQAKAPERQTVQKEGLA
jgi:MFS family permease